MKRINHTTSGENLIGILLILFIGFALILFSSGRTNAHVTATVGATSFLFDRVRVQQIYTSQIGVREKGVNTGPEVEKYLRYVNLPKGNPWCAAFVCWALGEAGIANPRTGWSPGLFPDSKVIWQRTESGKLKTEGRSGVTYSYPFNTKHITGAAIRCAYPPPAGARGGMIDHKNMTPTIADIFGLYFPEKKRIAHVGFIDRWDGTWMISVEGNTNVSGSREGDGVYRKLRLVKTIYKVARYVRELRIKRGVASARFDPEGGHIFIE